MAKHNLFFNNVKQLKMSSVNGQYIGLCPFHNDRNPSFSLNVNDWIWNCHAGCGSGDAADFAERIGLDPKPYYKSNNNSNISLVNPIVTKNIVSKLSQSDYKKAKEFNKYLLNNWMSISKPSFWKKNIIKSTLTGYDLSKHRLTFIPTDYDGFPQNIRWHKGKNGEPPQSIKGHGQTYIYPLGMIDSFDDDIYLVEGEKDCITTLSYNLPAITFTNGAGAIPEDLSYLSQFKNITICYDKDDAGLEGSKKHMSLIKNQFPNQDIKLFQWDDKYPKGFDITDYFEEGHSRDDFIKMVYKNNRIGVFKVITGYEADKMIPKDTELIIDKILPKGFMTIIAGSTGCNKSYLAMQLGISIANNENSFLGFNINKENLNVLYVDTEVGEEEMVRRYKRIIRNYNWNGSERFNMISKEGSFTEIWEDLKQAVNQFKPDLIIIDCLYNTSFEKDYSKSSNISKITNHITELKNVSEATILCIHHFNKSNGELGLFKDRMSGASALQNWVEHLILITETNDSSIRLMKIDKSRAIDYPKEYYGLRWNPETHQMNMAGIVKNWKKYLANDERKEQWSDLLNEMEDEFSTKDWVKSVEDKKQSDRTAKSWLNKMITIGLIKKVKHGLYKKTDLGFIENEVLE